jgi:hypothetical protein
MARSAPVRRFILSATSGDALSTRMMANVAPRSLFDRLRGRRHDREAGQGVQTLVGSNTHPDPCRPSGLEGWSKWDGLAPGSTSSTSTRRNLLRGATRAKNIRQRSYFALYSGSMKMISDNKVIQIVPYKEYPHLVTQYSKSNCGGTAFLDCLFPDGQSSRRAPCRLRRDLLGGLSSGDRG